MKSTTGGQKQKPNNKANNFGFPIRLNRTRNQTYGTTGSDQTV